MNKQMVRLGFLLVGSGCFVVPMVLGQTGCFGSSNPTTPGSTSSSTDTTSGSSTTAGDGGSSTSGSSIAACTNTNLLIDDMSAAAGPTAQGGYWYTYSDRTCVSPLPALIRGDAAGTVLPQEGQQFLAISGSGDGPDPCGSGTPLSYRDFSGGGENNWGAGMGFDLGDTAPTSPFTQAGSQVLGQSCASAEQCTGMEAPDAFTPPADAGGSFAAPFDASAYAGVLFFARAPDATAASPVKVNVQLSDKSTNPAGGTCDQCLYGGPALSSTTVRCADDWLKTVSFTNSWTQVKLMFNDPLLKTGGWSTNSMPRASSQMDLKSLYYVHFQISTANYPAPVKTFHIQVAYVAFIPK